MRDEEIIERILIGCVLFVKRQEDYWYNERLKPRKISDKHIARMPVFWPSISMSGHAENEFRGIPKINEKLFPEKLSPSVILNRGLKMLLNVGYHEKVPGKIRDGTPGQNYVYSETEYVLMLKNIVSNPKYRADIYSRLYQTGILERFLTICNYSLLLRYKHLDPEQLIRVRKPIEAVEEKEIDDYRKEYFCNKNELMDRRIREIFLVSCNLAAMQLRELNWKAEDYTRFFIGGGICYLEVERLGLIEPKPTPKLS